MYIEGQENKLALFTHCLPDHTSLRFPGVPSLLLSLPECPPPTRASSLLKHQNLPKPTRNFLLSQPISNCLAPLP